MPPPFVFLQRRDENGPWARQRLGDARGWCGEAAAARRGRRRRGCGSRRRAAQTVHFRVFRVSQHSPLVFRPCGFVSGVSKSGGAPSRVARPRASSPLSSTSLSRPSSAHTHRAYITHTVTERSQEFLIVVYGGVLEPREVGSSAGAVVPYNPRRAELIVDALDAGAEGEQAARNAWR